MSSPTTPAQQLDMPFRYSVASTDGYMPDWVGIDRSSFLRLDRNESTEQVAPYVSSAIREFIDRQHSLQLYPEPELILPDLSSYCAVPPDWILPTNGSDQAIDIMIRSFVGEGDAVLVASPTFPVYSHIAQLSGATIIGIPYLDNFVFPYEQFLNAAAQRRPKLIVLLNPNNPTGTPIDIDYIRLIARTHPGTPVVVDEAYYEFTGKTVLPYMAALSNLIVLRTFSKAFALAGLRLGYIVAQPENVAQFSKLRNQFDVNALALVAAKAQLQQIDDVFRRVSSIMSVVKPRVMSFLQSNGVRFWEGAANFVLVQPNDAESIVHKLYKSGILVRPLRAPGVTGMFRMSMGSETEMQYFTECYKELL